MKKGKTSAKTSKRIKEDTEDGKDILAAHQCTPTEAEGHRCWKRRKRGGSAAGAKQQVV